jgi:glutamate N-acetyltransferase / amino-acid N-acetyltransferase
MTSDARSPLASPFPAIPPINGVTPRIARARYKEWDRCDLTYITFDMGTNVAGVLTKSKCASSEVDWCRENLPQGKARALIVSAGSANAFTGYLACPVEQVFCSSTGVIGVPLPIDKAEAGLAAAFSAEPCSWEEAAATIMTTDTFAKGAVVTAVIGDKTVTLAGIIKGSGMIAPDMATMLGYIFSDAAVDASFLQHMLSIANRTTFSCITVDSDTSTSDTVLAFATGQAGHALISSFDDDGADAFQAALTDLCRQLAQLVVRDGEGATKFITVAVTGAVSDESAHRVAMSIANSPLVKTAIAGGDANWGRVVMAVGKAGEPADRDKLSISFGPNLVAKDGLVVPNYDETPVTAHVRSPHVDIGADLGLGNGQATVWTCDLTHGYISINADYRS